MVMVIQGNDITKTIKRQWLGIINLCESHQLVSKSSEPFCSEGHTLDKMPLLLCLCITLHWTIIRFLFPEFLSTQEETPIGMFYRMHIHTYTQRGRDRERDREIGQMCFCFYILTENSGSSIFKEN